MRSILSEPTTNIVGAWCCVGDIFCVLLCCIITTYTPKYYLLVITAVGQRREVPVNLLGYILATL